jgi:hypothetical protein
MTGIVLGGSAISLTSASLPRHGAVLGQDSPMDFAADPDLEIIRHEARRLAERLASCLRPSAVQGWESPTPEP